MTQFTSRTNEKRQVENWNKPIVRHVHSKVTDDIFPFQARRNDLSVQIVQQSGFTIRIRLSESESPVNFRGTSDDHQVVQSLGFHVRLRSSPSVSSVVSPHSSVAHRWHSTQWCRSSERDAEWWEFQENTSRTPREDRLLSSVDSFLRRQQWRRWRLSRKFHPTIATY